MIKSEHLICSAGTNTLHYPSYGGEGARARRWLIQFIKIINVINKASRSRLFLRQYCSSKGAFIFFLMTYWTEYNHVSESGD